MHIYMYRCVMCVYIYIHAPNGRRIAVQGLAEECLRPARGCPWIACRAAGATISKPLTPPPPTCMGRNDPGAESTTASNAMVHGHHSNDMEPRRK